MPAIMVQGCTSWAGKSLLTTALCRWFSDQGLSVAPFKAQNLSNNARVVDGGEIGTAQWLQARAARVLPEVRMNPVLVKPEAGGSQVVRLGKVDHALSREPWQDRSEALWPTVTASLDHLVDRHDLVVIEGAGSPAEINLAERDIANMRVAVHADAPVLLVADIDRGGAFAHLYGTWSIVGDEHRDRIRGFVLNRFRGDADLLDPAPRMLEGRTGVPTIGVLPMLEHGLPDEDGADLRITASGGPAVAIVRYPTASNLDEFTALQDVARVHWVRRPDDLRHADLVVLPGSKHVAHDRQWLRTSEVGEAVAAAADRGTPIVGVCGGLQLLGRRFEAPAGVDGSDDGLGLLPVTTRFAPDKHVSVTTTEFPTGLPGPWSGLGGLPVTGYEIRHGSSQVDGRAPDLVELPGGLGFATGNVLGCYLHGMFEDPDVVEALIGRRLTTDLEATFDTLATAVDDHLDTGFLRSLVSAPRRSR